MKIIKNPVFIGIMALLIAVGGFFAWKWNAELNLAHSTFENYYAFRGCTELIDRTDTYGDCKLSNGTTIKLVKINEKWYLDGDGPGIW